MKEFKYIRYSVKYYPDGKIVAKKLKYPYVVGREVEKEKLKNEFISYLYDDMYSLFDTNFSDENFTYDEFKELGKTINMEDSSRSEENLQSSINRTRSKIYDIVYCNEWTFFCTFTFNMDYVDRYCYLEVSKKLRKFLNYFRNRFDNNLKYIIIPEKHLDGAYHFHGLIYTERKDQFIKTERKDKSGRIIYEWINYHYGWNHFTIVKSKERCRSYMMKYITKDLFEDNDFCKRHFSCSQNCERPIKCAYEKLDLKDFDFIYENDFVEIYEKNVASCEFCSC